MSKSVESKLTEYLKSVGLKHHPFEPLEASADRRLNQHSIEHPVLSDAWARDVCFIVGEPGSGRTTVVEQLLYDCRIGRSRSRNGSGIFPVCLREGDLTSDNIQDKAVRAAATETLLELACSPWKFESLELKNKTDLVAAIELAAPGILDQFLPQILKTGNHLPVARFVDPPAETFPKPSEPNRVREMARQMQELNQSENLGGKSLPSILDIVPAIFGLAEIKLMADFQESPRQEELAELDRFHDHLSQQKIVSKVILAPVGLESGNREEELINWTPEQLVDVLESRMDNASGGNFDSLGTIRDLGLIHIEERIVNEAVARGHRTPRAVVSFAKTLLELQARSGNKKSNKISSETFNKAVEKEFATSV